mmetsp:Transcript_44757/g.142522  ORF Transcript_44757/g.142522 Transcript_44757/m.142522 type:complete len:391 (+) Transcript_44757:168-1340(+)
MAGEGGPPSGPGRGTGLPAAFFVPPLALGPRLLSQLEFSVESAENWLGGEFEFQTELRMFSDEQGGITFHVQMGRASGGDDDAASDDTPAPVLELACEGCGAVLTRRGMEVRLVADEENVLYSSDIPTPAVKQLDARMPIDTCSCEAMCVACVACEREVGYHVTQACRPCMDHENNGHYWLFSRDHINAKPLSPEGDELALNWGNVSYSGGPEPSRTEVLQGEPTDLTCHICAMVVHDAVKLGPCGHGGICRGCAMREVDARHSCPLCRAEITQKDIKPDGPMRKRANAVRARCLGCQAEVRWGRMMKHLAGCTAKPAEEEAGEEARQPSAGAEGGGMGGEEAPRRSKRLRTTASSRSGASGLPPPCSGGYKEEEQGAAEEGRRRSKRRK